MELVHEIALALAKIKVKQARSKAERPRVRHQWQRAVLCVARELMP